MVTSRLTADDCEKRVMGAINRNTAYFAESKCLRLSAFDYMDSFTPLLRFTTPHALRQNNYDYYSGL
jgi:hypothetical protein